jgi:RNA polymerase sigma-70 factor (ECF subfamily)
MKAGPHKAGARRADFEALYQRHGREVWAMAYARWMDADTALDIAQEAFMRLWKQWEVGESILNPRAWLLRVARNLAEDYAKSAFRRNGTHPPQLMNGVRAHDPMPLDSLDYNANEIADMLAINATAVHMRLSRARQRLADRLTAEGVVQVP